MGLESSAFGSYASLKTAADGYKKSSHKCHVSRNQITFQARKECGGWMSFGNKLIRNWTDNGQTHLKAHGEAGRTYNFRYLRGAWEFNGFDGRTYRQGLPVDGPGGEMLTALFSICKIL